MLTPKILPLTIYSLAAHWLASLGLLSPSFYDIFFKFPLTNYLHDAYNQSITPHYFTKDKVTCLIFSLFDVASVVINKNGMWFKLTPGKVLFRHYHLP